jgi:Mg/Co/Ni transporter MgtE
MEITENKENENFEEEIKLENENDTEVLIPNPRDEDLIKEEKESNLKLLFKRAIWLVGLLILQSISSFILSEFEAILNKHMIIALFLTMVLIILIY